MRISCNGCRALRKGCSDDCIIKPCLQWIQTPESQANATLFLAKFYGRAGLLNLINAGADDLRPSIFRSLLYEACGRIVNPIYGSAGLLWSGSWQLCEAAVEAVLKGEEIVQVSSDVALSSSTPPLKAGDIRHVSKQESSDVSNQLCKVKTRSRFKRPANKSKTNSERADESREDEGLKRRRNEKSDGSVMGPSCGGDSGAEGDSVSVETVEPCLAKLEEPADGSQLNLELTLGI